MVREKLEIQAFDLSREDAIFYLTALNVSELFPLCRVDRVNSDFAEGFQRQLDKSRARRIAKYLEAHVVPGAIILSARNIGSINYDNGKLIISDEVGQFLVIDGQHRLYGAQLAYENSGVDVKLPVSILCGLSIEEEIEYFIDINSTAKGVPKTLRIELTRYLVKPESIEDIRLRLFKDLNAEASSPLCGRLSAEQKGRGNLSHVPFELALNRVLASNLLKEMNYDEKKSLIKNYLIGVYRNLEEIGYTQKITQSAFFQAIFRVFDKACESSLLFHKNFKPESFEKVFKIFLRMNMELHTGTNEEAIKLLETDMSDKLDIERRLNISKDIF